MRLLSVSRNCPHSRIGRGQQQISWADKTPDQPIASLSRAKGHKQMTTASSGIDMNPKAACSSSFHLKQAGLAARRDRGNYF
jgi:hypothetical protein